MCRYSPSNFVISAVFIVKSDIFDKLKIFWILFPWQIFCRYILFHTPAVICILVFFVLLKSYTISVCGKPLIGLSKALHLIEGVFLYLLYVLFNYQFYKLGRNAHW